MQLQTVAEKSRDDTALRALKKKNKFEAHSAIFFVLLMYGCATDFLARRWQCEECAGFLGEHMLRAALGVKTELFPEWGK